MRRFLLQPLIEEFNHPLPEKCSGGNTGVFVNGRELHQKDLDLLSGRGLPPDRDRSYIIEISGRVLDEDTGEELDCLGKLAPTLVPCFCWFCSISLIIFYIYCFNALVFL
jgi:hypothetical protein